VRPPPGSRCTGAAPGPSVSGPAAASPPRPPPVDPRTLPPPRPAPDPRAAPEPRRCPHCYDQKELFGAQAMKEFPYVECFPDGWKRGKDQDRACQEADIQGYPTWVINGKKLEGGKDLETLRELVRGRDLAEIRAAQAAQ